MGEVGPTRMALSTHRKAHRRAVAGLALLSSTQALACATAAPPGALGPLPAPAKVPVTAAPDPGPSVPLEPPAPMPPQIEMPEEVGCSWWSAGLVTSNRVVELRLRPGGPAFAEVTRVAAHVETPAHEHDHAILDARSGGFVVSGAVDAAALRLFATAPFALNGVLYPQPTMALSWTGGGPGEVSVSAGAPSEITPAKPLSATVACGAVSLDPGRDLDMNQALLGRKYGASYSVARGRFIQVHSDPTEPAEARLFLSEGAIAQGFESRGTFTFITLELDDSVVAGWVRTANLTSTHGGMGHGGRLSSIRGWGEGRRHPLAKVVCPAMVPVAAEVSSESRTVGLVVPGTVVEILERRGAFSRVFVAAPGIHLLAGTTLLARASDLAACAAVEAPER